MGRIILKPGQRIRTLGLYQPFATLMLYGKIETRWVGSLIDRKTGKQKWKKPPFPFGKYLIYATQKAYGFHTAEEMMGDQVHDAHVIFKREIALGLDGHSTINVDRNFITGHAICVGDLVHIIDPITPDTKKTFVEYVVPCTRRRVGLVFQNVQRIKPFEFTGKQGVGFLPDYVVSKIETL